jgi:hypothetical protein
VEQGPEDGSNVTRAEASDDDARLRGRKKALKGWPHERIRHETGPAGSGRIKAPGGCENLEAQAS